MGSGAERNDESDASPKNINLRLPDHKLKAVPANYAFQ
jgi:hypothetical protein